MKLYLSRVAARHVLEILTSRINKVCSFTEHVHVEQLMTVDEFLRIVGSHQIEREPEGAD